MDCVDRRAARESRYDLRGDTIVAHDLRNPLNAITMKAALLRQGLEPEKVRQQAESIVNIGGRTGAESAPGQGACFCFTIPLVPRLVSEESALGARLEPAWPGVRFT